MKSIAKTISLMARQQSISRRMGQYTQKGTMFEADSSPQGTAHTMASTVPHTAMCIVTIISRR